MLSFDFVQLNGCDSKHFPSPKTLKFIANDVGYLDRVDESACHMVAPSVKDLDLVVSIDGTCKRWDIDRLMNTAF
jgi:hypothetical protein